MKRLTVQLDAELSARLERYCKREGDIFGLQAFVMRKALREFLDRAEGRPLKRSGGTPRVLDDGEISGND